MPEERESLKTSSRTGQEVPPVGDYRVGSQDSIQDSIKRVMRGGCRAIRSVLNRGKGLIAHLLGLVITIGYRVRFHPVCGRQFGRVERGLAALYCLVPPRWRGEEVLHRTLQAFPRDRSPMHAEHGRLLLVCGSLGHGGAERQLVNTAIGVHSQGVWKVSVLCYSLNTTAACRLRPELEAAGVDVLELPPLRAEHRAAVPRRTFWTRVLWGLGTPLLDDVSRYASEFQRLRPQLVHLWLDEINVKGGLGALLAGVPVILLGARSLAPYNFLIFRRYMRAGYRVLLRQPNVTLLNNSNAGAADYAAWLRQPPHRCHVIYNGVDSGRWRFPGADRVSLWREAAGIPPDRPLVGTIARFYEEKRPLLWVRVAAQIAKQHPDVLFLMVGAGVYHERVVALASRLGIGGSLFIRDNQPDTSLPLGCMTVFLLTSRLEGTPNVLIEAQACGVPVVATRGGGTEEAVQEGVTGLIVDSASPRAIARRVLQVLRNEAWRAEASRQGPSFAERQFGMSRMVTEMLDTYRNSLALQVARSSNAETLELEAKT